MSTATQMTPANASPPLSIKQHPRTGAFKQILESDGFQRSLSAALPRHISAGRMLRVVLAAFQNNSEILNCTPESVLLAILQAAACGLEPDGGPLGQAYLVPYKKKCQFIPGYRGLVKLARNSGEVADVWAEVVYEKDTFSYEKGLHPKLSHVPDDSSGDRGNLKFVYAVARFRDGERKFVVLNKADVFKIRGASPSYTSEYSPWKKWESAMWQKTAVRQLAKLLPLSVEIMGQIGSEDDEDDPAEKVKLEGLNLAMDIPAIEDQSSSEEIDSESHDSSGGNGKFPPSLDELAGHLPSKTSLTELDAYEANVLQQYSQEWQEAGVAEFKRRVAERRGEISPSSKRAAGN